MPVSCFGKGINLSILIIAIFFLLTCFYGIDKGMSLIGFLKFLGVPFFVLYLEQMSEEERAVLRALVPVLGCFMTLVGIIGRFIPPLYQFFYVADRLGGFFQYPNVFALFCLVGLLLLLEEQKMETEQSGVDKFYGEILQAIILLIGILLSGSRTVFFLTVLAALLVFWHFPGLRKAILILLAVTGVLIVVIAGISGNLQNAGRFLTTSLNSSTLLGRILYWQDGIRELIHHPFGMGYLGYFYREPVIQRAVYSVRFIHNDFLQLALDVGIIPAIGFLAAFGKRCVNKELPHARRIAILVMLLHFLMDFDLEFTAIWYLLVLLAAVPARVGHKEHKGKERKAAITGIQILLAACSCISLYAGIAMIPRYVGNAELSAKLLPFYTEANVDVLSAMTDSEEAEKLAEKIIRQNSYVPEAYDIEAVLALAEEDYAGMAVAKEKSLALQKYDMDSYERYLALLAKGIGMAAEKEDYEGAEILLQAAVKVPDLLKETEEQTVDLAYKIKDVPDFTLSEWAQEFLEEAQESLELFEES